MSAPTPSSENSLNDTGRTAVLLINLGTPDTPTAPALRRYLREFLSDPRVVELPRILWWPILHGIVLNIPASPFRPRTLRRHLDR